MPADAPRPEAGSGRKRRARLRAGLVATAAVALLFACREGPKPFEPDPLPQPDSAVWRLSFNPGQDHAPSWSADGDSVYYAAEGFVGVPAAPAVLVSAPRGRGRVTPLFPALEAAGDEWFEAPALAPTKDRVAFVEVTPWGASICADQDFCEAPEGRTPSPAPVSLRALDLHVRPVGALGPLDADPRLAVVVPGVKFDATIQHGSPPGAWVVETFPFQAMFRQQRLPFFRPSWAADGRRLAFTDGQRLLVWSVGSGSSTAVPGAADAAWAAWRPGTDVVAFTRYAHDPGTTRWCMSVTSTGRTACNQLRVNYFLTGRILATVRVDGTGYTELGVGEEPAWSADGGTLFFRRDDKLWRASADGSNAAPIPGTDGGHEPAPSPDGKYLAFTRASTTNGTFDVWVASLSAP